MPLILWSLAWPAMGQVTKTVGRVEAFETEFRELVATGAQIEVLADGYEWAEGPVWFPRQQAVLFSDIPNNRILRWSETDGVSIFLQPSGYTGKPRFPGREPGSNGLAIDPAGRLTICCHGDRCIKQWIDGRMTILADRFEGKRFNSPNDLVYHRHGDLYFTDPPYGLPKQMDDPARELDWCGVYRISNSKVTLLTKSLQRPNGIGFSPDFQTLYVAQSDGANPNIYAFPVNPDGTLGTERILFDIRQCPGRNHGGPDGLAVDMQGNLWVAATGGIIVVSPQGQLLGRLETNQATANCAFGGADGSILFITADMLFCRVPTRTRGMK